MRPLGDRRFRVRFEVLGTLRGTLELSETAQLLNISSHGALVESRARVALGSFQELRLNINGQRTRVTARVSRLEATTVEPGQSPAYKIGLDFLSPPVALVETIARLTEGS
jgi:hypothetical protein